MNKKKMLLVTLAALVLILVSLAWIAGNYHVIEFRLYPKKAVSLDLRGTEISVEHYGKLRAKMPDIEIRWDIPFQGGIVNDDTKQITVTDLSDKDVEALVLLEQLEIVDAQQCTDYTQLLQLQEKRPDVQVDFFVTIDGEKYRPGETRVELECATPEEIEHLQYLKQLKAVVVRGGEDTTHIAALQEYCHQNNLEFYIRVSGTLLPENTEEISVSLVNDRELELLRHLPKLTKLHIQEPVVSAEYLLQMREDSPHVQLTWEKTILGVTFAQDAVNIDLTDVISRAEGEGSETKTAYQYGLEYNVQGSREEVASSIKVLEYHPLPDKTDSTGTLIAEVEAAMEYFPEAEKLVLCGAWLNNAEMAGFRESHRGDYKVVWSVQCGNLATRTDAKLFMPIKYRVYYFQDADAYNLRYCEEIISMDIGHMSVSCVDFLQYMPNLEYLVLAHTQIRYIEPIKNCKKLKFLEVDYTPIRDLSPLLECTALEDLNIGMTSVDVEPVKQMTWLKNLWMVSRASDAYEVSQALPNTKIMATGNASVANGWRKLPNYYAMRDALMMFYMTW